MDRTWRLANTPIRGAESAKNNTQSLREKREEQNCEKKQRSTRSSLDSGVAAGRTTYFVGKSAHEREHQHAGEAHLQRHFLTLECREVHSHGLFLFDGL